jgi:hypothetical protein
LWAKVAELGRGKFASIDHNHIVAIATPMDKELAKLSDELNQTYVAYGAEGDEKAANQRRQDSNAATMGGAATASRAVAKASKLYRSDDWDLVAAQEAGKDVARMPAAVLPAPMREMKPADRKAFVDKKAKERTAIQGRIAELSKQRDAYVATERKKSAAKPAGLDDALSGAIHSQGEAAGLKF